MKKGLPLAVSTIFLSGLFNGAYSQSLPRLVQGEPYKEARGKLLDNGWQKVKKYKGAADPCKMTNATRVCYLYPEYDDSSSDGFCRFLWSNLAGKTLVVGSYPCVRSDPGEVTGWQWQ